MNRKCCLFFAAIVLCFLEAGPLYARDEPPGPAFQISVQPWEEARKLFRSDSHWLGGDGASSVDLGNGRVLWLFGDSFIDLSGSGSRRNAAIVRNSVAIQNGHDPETARMTFSWRVLGNRARSFFSEEHGAWFWPGTGIRLGDVLLVFLVRVHRADNALGFEPAGWKAVIVPNPDSAPTLWGMMHPEIPPTNDVLVGSASAFILDDFLYAFGSDAKARSVHAVRWPLADAAAGNLAGAQWWMGSDRGWVKALSWNERPVPVFLGGQVEFSVHYEPDLKGFIQVQTLSLADPCLAVRFTDELSLPWSLSVCFYQPSERASRGLLIYAGKAHKVFDGADVAFTYAVNTTSEERLMNDMELYYPVVLKGTFMKEPRDGSEHTTPGRVP